MLNFFIIFNVDDSPPQVQSVQGSHPPHVKIGSSES